MYFKIITCCLVLLLSPVLSKHIPSLMDIDDEDHHLYQAAYDSPSYEPEHEEYEQDNKLDLVKDGLWALKAKMKEIKAFNKAFAASLLETKLKLKEMTKHHHHKKPTYEYHAPAPAYHAPPAYPAPAYQPQPQYIHDPYYGH